MAEKREKNLHAAHLGKMGGSARTQKLSPGKRSEIARKAARARWAKSAKKRDGQ